MATHIDGFIANTPYSAAYFLRVYPSVPKEKVHVVEMITPHYVRAAHKLPKRAKETARLRVMIPGNFTVGKGGNQMIRIFNVMREAAIEFTIMGWIEPHFQEVLAQLHIPNLNILGGYEQKNALQLFQNYDVSLHLSIWPETYMISLSEAWICGVIPIVTDLGAPGERVTDGVDGLKVPVNDSGAVIDALERLTYDMDYREKLRTGILRKKHGTEREHLNLLRKRYSHLIRQYPVPHINANDRSLVTYDLTLCDTGIRTNAPDWHTNDNHWDEKMPCETLEMSDEAANRVFNAIPTKYSHLKREKLSANSAEHTILIDQIMADEEPEKPSEKNIWATRNMLISGWAYKDAYGPCLDLYAQLKRANSVFVVKAQMDRRPDVASYLDKPDALHSGFSVFWELSSLPAGKYHFSVVQIYDGLIADFNDLFTVRIEQKTKALDTIPHAIPAEYAHFKIQQWSKWEGEELLVHIDQIAVDGGKIENNVRLFHSDKSIAMSGWAFWKNSGQALDTYIRLRGDNEDFIFPAEIEKRPDVAEFFGDKAAIHSGFRISAYVASLPSGNYALDVIQVYEDLVVEFKDLLAIALKARKAA